ncbi:hypothetical protein ColKHC_09433 [Colletotrichum higginsianum]|nr:hypothetical protein ColKHC_09433 [Colletotrichum higginsianum]
MLQIHADNIRIVKALQNGDSALQVMCFVAGQQVLADATTENFRIKCVQDNYDSPNPTENVANNSVTFAGSR